jgi:hypothetical protein
VRSATILIRRPPWGFGKGEEAARPTGTAPEVAEALVDDLSPIAGVTTKRMFGGVGIFANEMVFVMVDSSGRVFFR